jgi:hypothetical protein
MPETNIQIVLKPKDPKDAELASFGARLLKLLRSPQAQKNHYFIATLDDFLGVVYRCLRNRCEKPIHRLMERRLRVVCDARNFVEHAQWISRKSGEEFLGHGKISGAVHYP